LHEYVSVKESNMGKVPSFVIIIIGVVLILGVSAYSYSVPIKHLQVALAKATSSRDATMTKAKTLPDVKNKLAQAVEAWLAAKQQEKDLMKAHSIPISFYTPIPAMIRLWMYYREELPGMIKKWVEASGVKLVSPITIPAPPGTPPTPPASGFMLTPEAPLPLTIVGSLDAIERFYSSMPQFPRIGTLGGLALTGSGDQITCTVPLSVYLLVEMPSGGGGAAPAAGGALGGPPAGMPSMPGGAGGPPSGGPPKASGGAPPAGGGDSGGGGIGGGLKAHNAEPSD
jgi:hypothetical protein